MRFQFPKCCRLLKRKDFKAVQKAASHYAGKYIVVHMQATPFGRSRLGIAASKKFGKSHERNRFKRLIREAYRLNVSSIPQEYDLLVRPRKAALGCRMSQIAQELLAAAALLETRIKTDAV